MRILLVSNGYPPSSYGGVEVYVSELVAALTARGHEVAVFCREDNPSLPDFSLLEDETKGTRIFRVVNTFKNVRAMPEVWVNPEIERVYTSILDRFQPDMVHFNHTIALSARLPEITFQRHIANVFTLHDFWLMCQKVHLINWQGKSCSGPKGNDCFTCSTANTSQPWYYRYLRLAKQQPLARSLLRFFRQRIKRGANAAPLFDIQKQHFVDRFHMYRDSLKYSQEILVPSEFLREIFQANDFPGETFTVLSLGIKGTPVESEPEKQISTTLRFGFAGNIVPFKGVTHLIEAFRQVNHPNVELRLFGRDNANPAYSAEVHALAAGDPRIHFMGAVPPENRYDIFRQIDLLVIPTTGFETFSYVAREALVSGVPVVAANGGALPEIIREGVNGYLYPVGDSPALAAVLSRIASQPELIKKLALPGPVPIHSVESHVDALEGIYQRAVCSTSALPD